MLQDIARVDCDTCHCRRSGLREGEPLDYRLASRNGLHCLRTFSFRRDKRNLLCISVCRRKSLRHHGLNLCTEASQRAVKSRLFIRTSPLEHSASSRPPRLGRRHVDFRCFCGRCAAVAGEDQASKTGSSVLNARERLYSRSRQRESTPTEDALTHICRRKSTE